MRESFCKGATTECDDAGWGSTLSEASTLEIVDEVLRCILIDICEVIRISMIEMCAVSLGNLSDYLPDS